MTCNFRVGQKVVCVDDRAAECDGVQRLFVGHVYTIRSIQEEYSADGWVRMTEGCLVRLNEITSRVGSDHPYGACRFRPIVERNTDISIFKAMLTPSKTKVKA